MESEIQNTLLLRYSKSGMNSQLMLKKADAKSGQSGFNRMKEYHTCNIKLTCFVIKLSCSTNVESGS